MKHRAPIKPAPVKPAPSKPAAAPQFGRSGQRWPRALRACGPSLAGYFALIALLIGFGGWSVLTTISGAIIAPGRLEVAQSRQVVQHPEGGVVGKILVREGASVKAGQILVQLDATAKKSELSVVEGQYFELLARRGRLEAERDDRQKIAFDPLLLRAVKANPAVQDLIDGQRRLFRARRLSLQKEAQQMGARRIQILAQIDGFNAQNDAQKKQLALVRSELADKQTLLAKGLVQASHVLALRREAARLQGIMGEIKANRAEAGGRVVETKIGILRLFTGRREKAITRLRDLQDKELQLSEKRIGLKDTLSRLDIRAPVAGTVFGLKVHAVRAVIRAADPLMYIVPSKRDLVITSRIAITSIDQVHVGQRVALRFSAFDQRTTPELFGKVVKLSADAFTDNATRTSYYRAEIRPEKAELQKLGGLKLLPGMPVETFIRTVDRTPWNYLMKPVTDYFGKAFREG